MSLKKDIKQLVDEIEGQGWVVRAAPRRSHFRCQAPGGAVTFLPMSPSDWRSVANCRAQLRRLGAML
jgi:hypothetical protein